MFHRQILNDGGITHNAKKTKPSHQFVNFMNLVGSIYLMALAVKCTLESTRSTTNRSIPRIRRRIFTPRGILLGILIQVDVVREDCAQRGITFRNLLGEQRKFCAIGNLVGFSHGTLTGRERCRNGTVPHICGKDVHGGENCNGERAFFSQHILSHTFAFRRSKHIKKNK